MNFRLRGNDVTFERAAGDEEARTALKIVVPKAPWSAVAAATAFGSGSTAAASLPHSMALRAFSWFLGARQPTSMSDCLENTQGEVPLPRLRDRNDSLNEVLTQNPQGRELCDHFGP